MMRVLVLQHSPVDDLGRFAQLLDEGGHSREIVKLQEGEAIPPIADYDAVWALGGPMDVWEDDEHPWLVAEKRAIREAVEEHQKPFLGVCLGHQLLASALGGTVTPMDRADIGVRDVTLEDTAGDDPIFRDSPNVVPTLQWHGAEVSALPAGAVVLAHSHGSTVQAFRYGTHAWGLQFHCEVERDTVASWCREPGYLAALEARLGPNAKSELSLSVANSLETMQDWTASVFAKFARLAASGSSG